MFLFVFNVQIQIQVEGDLNLLLRQNNMYEYDWNAQYCDSVLWTGVQSFYFDG